MAIGLKPSSLARPMISLQSWLAPAVSMNAFSPSSRTISNMASAVIGLTIIAAPSSSRTVSISGIDDRASAIAYSAHDPQLLAPGREGDALADQRLGSRLGAAATTLPTPSKPAGWPCLRGWPYWPLMKPTSDGLIEAEADLDQHLRRTGLRHRDGARLDIGLHRLQSACRRLRACSRRPSAAAPSSSAVSPSDFSCQGLRISLPADPRPSTRFSTAAASASG